MNNVLITGGAGFIGSHLCEEYLKMGYRVGVVDNFSTGYKKNIPKECSVFPISITNKSKLEEVFKLFKPTVISHHAAQTKVQESNLHPDLDAKANISGLITILELASLYRVKQVVFASSGGTVYGNTNQLPTLEISPFAPESAYGISKMTGEYYVNLYAGLHSFIPTIFRYANVYGPRQLSSSEGGVVAILAKQLGSGEMPVIYGSGEQTRDFVYVKDVAKLNVLATRQGLSGVFNVGTGTETSILELYTLVAAQLNSKIKPKMLSTRKNEVMRSSLNSQKLCKQLPHFTLTPLKKGLEETVVWYKNSQK